MSGCRRWGAEVAAYLDGELDEAAGPSFDAHLPDCEACGEALEAQRALDVDLRSLPRIEPSPQFEAQFWARLARAEGEEPVRGWLHSWRMRVAEVAFVAAGVGALAWMVTQDDPRATQTTALLEKDWEIVAEGERFELLLDEDHELLWSLEVLEAWDGSEEI
ncbi:MAG: zf-HC2 domain-containing protein [Deltaproteobacteria bacterium]|nr:zf-HC2 domain-containing protein [Deltaproteobacteria bacterium]MBW2412878.1 zf-HC2 domain-containing protein [Deltaproteobacteria bacterium]